MMNMHVARTLVARLSARLRNGLPLSFGMLAACVFCASLASAEADSLKEEFVSPPDAARPWVYWFFMDGNLTRDGITADLEAMNKAGIGGAICMEVGIGIERGPVEFMSPAWQELIGHAFSEANRLGLQLAMAAGPGWCGTGGPWVKPDQSMQHLVASETAARGPARFDAVLPRPQPRKPFFGEDTLTPELHKAWQDFYQDVALLAFPTPAGNARLADADEKALYFRAPYSSQPGVKPFLPAPAEHPETPGDHCIDAGKTIELTGKLDPDGRLLWDVPPGDWTIMRFGRTITGQTSRPAPAPGLGLESDKFDPAAMDAHFAAFIETLLRKVGEPVAPGRGLTTLHFDSWEMSSQNWSPKFRDEFKARRGYDPAPFLPAMSGRIVDSVEVSERFLWDLRQTAQELVIENHVLRLKTLGQKHGLELSIEPYDLNPCSDLLLGSAADVPMCEFWSKGWDFPTEYGCVEASSIAHVTGKSIVGAEAFTGKPGEDWQQYPASMKEQGDWALCAGINRFVFHRYQAQPWLDRYPGMTMGPYGVHWERTQTWWDFAGAYHRYLSRCQQMLRRGLFVADILYLAPEGAPSVFCPPPSAFQDGFQDRRGYTFDGCAPDILIDHASVQDGRIVFPDGMSYRMLVLPRFDTMTPRLLQKITELVEDGAVVLGAPPRKSPSLSGYPACDGHVRELAAKLWGAGEAVPRRDMGTGQIILDTAAPAGGQAKASELYPDYATTAKLLSDMGLPPDFDTDGNLRHIHRRDGGADFYFIANRNGETQAATCRFRVSGRQPEWWNPMTGACRDLPDFITKEGVTALPVRLDAYESGFVIFRKPIATDARRGANFPERSTVLTLAAPWNVSFDPKWGGPERVVFAHLEDWSKRPEPGIRHYSGKAVYRTTFDCPADAAKGRCYLSLGAVKNLAAIALNGTDLGVVWCDPWRAEIPGGVLKEHGNALEITVANLWINRLIGDAALPQEKRLTWTTYNPFHPDSPLQESGLLGPVTIQCEDPARAN